MNDFDVGDTVIYEGDDERKLTAVVLAIKGREYGYAGSLQITPVLTVRTVLNSGDFTLPHTLEAVEVVQVAAKADHHYLVHLALGDDSIVAAQFMHADDCADYCREIGATHVPFNAPMHPVPAVGTRYECAAVMNTVEAL